MKPLKIALALVAALVALVLAAGLLLDAGEPPRRFFGIAPQTPLTEADVEYMRAGGIGTVRWSVPWASVQPAEDGDYDWAGFDEVVEAAARGRLRVLPVLFGTPEWLADEPTVLPIEDDRQRRAWSEFLRAAVGRYGPGGAFWRERRGGSEAGAAEVPVREWQVWNEANFFCFATPASPSRYARLLKRSSRAIEEVDPEARIVLSGLFGDPPAEPPKGMPAAEFLDRLYAVDGIRGAFDGVALHAYAKDVETLEGLTEEIRETIRDNDDAGAQLYVTELGWGSQSESEVSFEKGPEGQARELRGAYEYLGDNRDDLNLRAVHWFTWKDVQGACDFCDSAGLFEEGEGFEAKPAWEELVEITGGDQRP